MQAKVYIKLTSGDAVEFTAPIRGINIMEDALIIFNEVGNCIFDDLWSNIKELTIKPL